MGYYTYAVKNTSDEKFMVVAKWGTVLEKMAEPTIFDTYEKAYRTAKAYGWGEEPKDETRHH